MGPQLKCVATLAGEKKKNDKQFVMGLSIEIIVNVTKRALDMKTSLQCVVRAGKNRVNLNLDKQHNYIS